MQKQWKKWLAGLLTAILFCSGIPTQDVFAAEIQNEEGMSKDMNSVKQFGDMEFEEQDSVKQMDEQDTTAEGQEEENTDIENNVINAEEETTQIDTEPLYDENQIEGKSLKALSATVGAVAAPDEMTYILVVNNLSDGSEVTGVRFGVWNNGLDDLRWYQATKDSSGQWLAFMSIADYKKAGTYYGDAYVQMTDGSSYKVGSFSFGVSENEAKTIKVSNKNAAEGTFDVVVGGVSAKSGVAKVEVPVWSASDLSDIYWYTAEKQSDGNYIAHVNIKNHKYNYSVYAMQAYITGNNGVKSGTVSCCENFAMPTSAIGAYGDAREMDYIFSANNLPYSEMVTGVRFGVWNSGLEDLRWYDAIKDSSGQWLTFMSVRDYGKSGTYYGDAYVQMKDGNSYKVGSFSFKVSDNKAASIKIANKNNSAGTFDIVINNVSAKSGVNKIEVPVWSASDLSDIHWYTASLQKDGTYIVHADIKNHKYHYGVYAMQAYITSNNGVRTASVSNCENFEMPKVHAGGTVTNDEKECILSIDNIPYEGRITGIRFGVWNSGLEDLRWYKAERFSNGQWLAFMSLRDYKKAGIYYADVYADFSDGTSQKIGNTSFSVRGPYASDIIVKDINEVNGTFTAIVNGVNAAGGIENVQMAVWCAADKSDLVVYTATPLENKNYAVYVDVKNHKGDLGTYHVQAYVKDKNGISQIVGQTTCIISRAESTYYNIMGSTAVTRNQMVDYYNSKASYPAFYGTSDAPTIEAFCQIYLEECAAEGVKVEVAFCQAMKETGFLRFGGDVSITQFNFAGLGATGGGASGATFSSVREGVRAQIQHLKAYASTEPLNNPCVDPRFQLVTRGVAPYVEWLGINENPYGKGWATDKNYGYSIKNDYISKLLNY